VDHSVQAFLTEPTGRAMIRMLAGFVFALAPLGGAADAQESLTLFGLGSLACDDWIHPADFANAGLKDWFLRFTNDLGADNSFKANPLKNTTPQKSLEWLDEFCKAHPLTGLNVAGILLVNELSRQAAGAK
jgi:hypothetical protein